VLRRPAHHRQPTHAREILTREFGWGLDGMLRERAGDLVGILNGADYDVWNPGSDPHLPRPYGPATLEAKEASKRALREQIGLPPSDRPVVGVVSRLVAQKGIDLLARGAGTLIEAGADLAVLGAGEPEIVHALEALQHAHPGRARLRLGYDEPFSHLVVAGSDLVLVPSRYEPCGLVQMHALRYGAIPVVHRTGGLADTVRDEGEMPGRGTGFAFDGLAPDSLAAAVRRALSLRRSDPAGWRALQQRAMAEDFSWDKAAAHYSRLYGDLLR